MADESWWPHGVAISSIKEALDSGELRTKWGTVSCWDVNKCCLPEWWNQPKQHAWGAFNDVKPSFVEVIRTEGNRTLLRLDTTHLALAYSIPTSNDASSIARRSKLKAALKSTPLHIPTGGLLIDEKDAVLLFSNAEFTETSPEWLGKTLGSIQASLEAFSTPNDQKRWNQRLKDLEDELKPNTLWRAPHSSSTVGIPSVRIHPNWIVGTEDEQRALPLNRTVSELLLCGKERLPGIAEFIHVEGRLTEEKGYEPEQIKTFFEHWKGQVPASWTNRKALSTVLGGAWIWRYYDVLVVNAESVLYGDESRYASAQKWLKDVSRLQAHLGVLRVWKSGVWVGIGTLVVAYYAWQLGTLSTTGSLMLAVVGAAISLGSNTLYWKKDPPAF